MSSLVKHITIIGMGMIGGSLGLAFKAAKGRDLTVTGVDTNEVSLAKALQCGAADKATTDLVAGVAAADVIFLCTPVLQIVPIIKTIAPYIKKGAIVTDVGSTKGYLHSQLPEILPPDNCFIAGHPMAGREMSGIEAADSRLFLNKWYILTPDEQAETSETGSNAAMIADRRSQQGMEIIKKVVGWTGAKIAVMDVASHDWCTAVISHLPHVAAAALVNLLDRSRQFGDTDCTPIYEKLAAGGFRDTTRIASSNPDMWADICLTNGEAIVENLLKLQSILNEIITDIQQGDRQAIHDFFASAKKRRDAIPANENGASPLTTLPKADN